MHTSSVQQKSDQSERDQRNWKQLLLASSKRIKKMIDVVVTIMLLLMGGIFILLSYTSFSDQLAYIIRELGVGMMTSAIITGFVSFFTRYNERMREDIEKVRENQVQNNLTTLRELATTETRKMTELQRNATTQTRELTKLREDGIDQTKQLIANLSSMKELIAISQSMKVLGDKGISRVYERREDAVEDMILDLRNHVTQIRIMGISLSNLIRDKNSPLHKVWDEITKYVRPDVDKADPRNPRLNIKILLIDPECLGARLRSRWESVQPYPRVTEPVLNLGPDVFMTARILQQFMKTIPSSETGIGFEVHLYRLPPQLFLLSTDMVSYMMPYYFWKDPRKGTEDMPLFKLTDKESQLYQGMNDHFDLIWEYASISLEQFLEEHYAGLDKGMHECGAINVYDNTEEVRKRMLHLLKNAKEKVYIQGVSLNSTLGNQPDGLIPIIADLVKRRVEVKILLLDPESEQAKFRAFREWFLQKNQPDITFKQYHQRASEKEKLYGDTDKTIERLDDLRRELLHQNVKIDGLSIMKYGAAPCCFMFLVDKTVLIEQYIYGVVVKPGGLIPAILGGEMPIVEYTSQPGNLYEARPDKHVFEMMNDHFNFVFDHFAHPIEDPMDAPANMNQPLEVVINVES